MSERFQQNVPDLRLPDFTESLQHLPGWLVDRLLRPHEKVTWVRGPRFNPSWERYVTHPALILPVLLLGAIGLGLGWLAGAEASTLFLAGFFYFIVFCVPIIIVLGIANGYFTRLVVTNFRLVILQGYEICRSWDIKGLPFSLRRYAKQGDQEHWSVDLDAVKAMLGGSSDKFTGAKTILLFGKQLDRIMLRDKDH
jgi:hypothetical protein